MFNTIPKIQDQIYYPSRMKNFFRSHLNSKNYVAIIPNVKSARVGNVPSEIINLFGNNKVQKTKVFLDALSNITRYLRAAYYNVHNTHEYNLGKTKEKKVKDFENKSSYLLTKFTQRLFPQGTKAEVKFAGRGEFACVYQISFLNKSGEKLIHDKALKVYHSVVDKEIGWHSAHGNYAEANFWTYIKYHAGHNLSKTQLTRHYISDMKSAYALTEFIDKDITKTTSNLDLRNLFKVFNFDSYDNKPILGKFYDVGLHLKDRGFTGDKMVMRYLKKLYYRSKKDLKPVYNNLTEQANNPKNEHRTKIKQAIDEFNNRFPDRLEWIK